MKTKLIYLSKIIILIFIFGSFSQRENYDMTRFYTLEECGNDTVLYMSINYSSNRYFDKNIDYIINDSIRGIGFKSYVIAELGGGKLHFLFYINTIDEINKKINDGEIVYCVSIDPARSLRPNTRFEECKKEYERLLKFGLYKLHEMDSNFIDLVKDYKIDNLVFYKRDGESFIKR